MSVQSCALGPSFAPMRLRERLDRVRLTPLRFTIDDAQGNDLFAYLVGDTSGARRVPLLAASDVDPPATIQDKIAYTPSISEVSIVKPGSESAGAHYSERTAPRPMARVTARQSAADRANRQPECATAEWRLPARTVGTALARPSRRTQPPPCRIALPKALDPRRARDGDRDDARHDERLDAGLCEALHNAQDDLSV